LATESAFDAAVETTDAALEAAFAIDVALLAALDAAFAIEIALLATLLTVLTAAILAAVSTERALDTTLAALLAALATDKAFDAAFALLASPVALDAASTLMAAHASDILSLRVLITDWSPWTDKLRNISRAEIVPITLM